MRNQVEASMAAPDFLHADRVGARVRAIREARGLSRRQLSDLAGCHLQTLLRLESGKMKMTETWQNTLARALGVSAQSLYPLGDSTGGTIPVVRVPVVPWTWLEFEATKLREMVVPTMRHTVIERRAEILPDDLIGLIVPDQSMDRVAAKGATIVVDRRDRVLVAGRYYLLRAGAGFYFRQYMTDPDRFDGDGSLRVAPLLRGIDTEVIGRAIEVTRDL